MNIALFTETYYPQMNGVVVSVEHFARELRHQGHTVWIFAPKFDGEVNDDEWTIRLTSINVLDIKPEVKFPLLNPNENYRKMFSLPFDVIHAHETGAFSLLAYQIARLRTIPFILTFHTMWTKYTHYVGGVITPPMVRGIMKMYGNLADGVTTPSEKMKRELKSYDITKPITVVPNFIKSSDFSKGDRDYIRNKYTIAQDKRILITIGRFGKEKNFDFIIRMFKKLHLKHPDTHLVIVGYGPQEKHLRSLVHMCKLNDAVTLTGLVERKKIPSFLRGSNVFVFASKSETQGIILLEASAAGIPIVTAQDSAYDGMLDEGKNGYLCPLRMNSFIEKIEKLLKDKELCHKQGIYGKGVIMKRFSEKEMTQKLVSVYQETIDHFDRKRPAYKQIINRETLNKLIKSTHIVTDFFK